MPHDQMPSEGGAATQQQIGTKAFRNPLPMGTEESIFGPVRGWPETLQAFALTVASFAYPAAVFYGHELAIFHNQPWADVVGVGRQGQKQRGQLTADVWEALSSAMYGGKPKRVDAAQLLGTSGKTSIAENLVLISPLFDHTSEDAVGLLAQLIPRDQPRNSRSIGEIVGVNDGLGKALSQGTPPKERHLDISELGNVVDEFPLDEHPFFHRFAEMLPSGLAILDHRAQAVFVNQLFYQLTTHHKPDKAFKSWPQSIHPEDYDRVMNAYQDAFTSQKQLRTEFRAIVESNPWRLLLLTPLGDENLRHVSLREYGGFICSIVDISSEKSAEISERKAAKEARERKEQQERFIDMISHEIRNPLSAILHCTEDIAEAVKDGSMKVDIDAVHEAVETIQLCIQHQRNIVDDVLSFSKLDSSMLSLSPKPCQPSAQLAGTLKMFQPEFRKQGMRFEYCLDESYIENQLGFVMADMARIGQVVINLVSNAVKFTSRSTGEKSVTISVGASTERPTSYPPNVVFFNADDLAFRMDATNAPAWGNGEILYCLVAVKDTGIGISEEGQRRLFERFRQATPKTAELYGGSGLGLNISRKMCHLHGGEIGVSSKEGSGSTFGFFFKVKKTDDPGASSTRDVQDAAIDSDELKSQVRALGNITGTAHDDEEQAQSSVNAPRVVHAEDATPHPDGSKDERYEETIKIASRVKEPAPDEYANSARPQVSHQHVSGEYLRSAELGKEAEGDEAGDSTGTRMEKQHVLLVEDNVINQRIVFRKLEAKGFNVTTANNGREAVNAVRRAPDLSSDDKGAFSIVLMDQEMPELDGNSATREIRELERQGVIEHVAILGLTANVRGEQLQEMLDAGMTGVISKPYKIEDLLNKIQKITADAKKS